MNLPCPGNYLHSIYIVMCILTKSRDDLKYMEDEEFSGFGRGGVAVMVTGAGVHEEAFEILSVGFVGTAVVQVWYAM